MKSITYLLFFLAAAIGWSQNNPDTLEFYPLTFYEKMAEANQVKLLGKADSLSRKDFFFTEQYNDEYGLFLVKKENKNWTVYDFELYSFAGRNTIIGKIKMENDHFVSIQTISTPSGICETRYEKIILLDITQNAFADFFTVSEIQCYDENGAATTASKCKAAFSIVGNVLKFETERTGDLSDCMASGSYTYENKKFVKLD